MSLSPFCFVHATNVRLDQPMWGGGEVSGEARRLVEDATNLAFEQIVETCLQQDAAFLLLTGNTIDAAHGHRARVLLERACERLAAQDCQVFLMPGESDPPHAWGDDLLYPDNFRVFLPDQQDPATVTRDGLTLATVEPYQDRQHNFRVPGDTGGLRISLIGGDQHAELQQQLADDAGGQLDVKRLERFPNLVSLDYLALGGGNGRVTVRLPCGLAHDPGCPQPLDGRETPALGCTVIEINEEGQLQTRLMPTAVVRREELEINVNADQTWDDVLKLMQSALSERSPLPTERLWLIRWIIEGEGNVLSSLREPAAQKELAELIDSELEDERVLRRHAMEIKGCLPDEIRGEQAGSIYEEFQAIVSDHAAEHLLQFCGGLASRNWPETNWVRQLIETAEQASTNNVHSHARHLARRHLLIEEQKAA